jgi:DNA polymerase-1
MTTVYETLERPLVPCSPAWSSAASPSTARSSRACPAISRRARRRLEDEIYELAGEPFNIGSPKQLGDILFGKMGLPGGKKTKTGQWSTGADVLEELAAQGIPLPRKIVDWRQLTKLKSTYTDALPGYINPRPGACTPPTRSPRPRPAGCRQRSEPAEHPGPHRGGPQDPHRLHRRARA